MVDEGALYLVTGGAGFVGSHLAEHLVREGAKVRVLDDFSTGRIENLGAIASEIEVLEGTVTDPADCARACSGARYVLHNAALPSIQRSVGDPSRTHAVNATGTLNMLEAARAAGVRRFVYASSSSAYGDSPTLPKREDMPTRPRSPYAVAKLTGEQYTRVFAQVFELETVSLRYFNIFGPRQDPTSHYSAVIPLFIVHGLEQRAPTIYGDGEQTRDFTYVANVVEANLLACRAREPGVVGEVFNVGCGSRTSVNDLWREIREIAGEAPDAHHGPPRPGDVRDSLADLSRARERLGYEVRIRLSEGLRRTFEWFEERMGAGSLADSIG